MSLFDLESIKAKHVLSEYIGRYVKLKRQGREYVGLSPFQKERSPSFTVSDDKGFFHDFSTGSHGDLLDFAQMFHSVDLPTACEILGGERMAPDTKPTQRTKPAPDIEIIPAEIPDSHEPFKVGEEIRAWNPKSGDHGRWVKYKPDYVFPYTSNTGDLIGYVIRLNMDGDKKITLPLRPAVIDDEVRWVVSGLDRPRPLYNIANVAPKGPVILVEGEKPADALSRMMDVGHLSWYGGTNGVAYADYSPLQGRDVVIWGDADLPGEKAAQHAAWGAYKAGAKSVRVVPWDQNREKGWDAADAEAEGWEALDVYALIEAALKYIPPETSPELEVDPEVDFDVEEEIRHEFDADPFSGELPPPRPWAFGRILLHRTVTALTAPPGTGKSTWAIQLAIAFSQGRAFGGFEPLRTGPAWVWNNEDDGDELLRRTLAACIAMDINPVDLNGRLYLNSGSDRQLIIAKEHKGGAVLATPDVDRVIDIIKMRGIKLLIVDPFAETFEVESENNNDAMKKVAALYRYIAQMCECSVLIITHPPKGTTSDRNAGSLDAIRGGGAIGGIVRSAYTLFEMSDDDAELCGVEKERKHFYLRLDNAKGNMGAPKGRGDATWWQREGIALNNGTSDDPEDVVGVLRHIDFGVPEKISAPKRDYSSNVLKIASEIVRVCTSRNHTDAIRGIAIDTLAGALDEDEIGLKHSMIKRLMTGRMGDIFDHGSHLIIVTEHKHGGRIFRRIHVEEK